MICLDIDITVAEVVLAGELASADLQPRLSPAVSADMDLLRTVLDAVSLQLTRDTRWIRGGPSTAVRVSDIYKALWSPVGGGGAHGGRQLGLLRAEEGEDLLLDPAP